MDRIDYYALGSIVLLEGGMQKMLITSRGLTEITIPESVTIIGRSAFEGRGSLTAICGKSGSYAEAYAAEHGYAFEEK